jgi:SAM-dependent methyltransferase
MTKLGRRLMRIVRPLRDRRADGFGTCSVCGWSGRFAVNSWMLPVHAVEEWGADWVEAFVRRESLFCRRCSSTLRIRRVADVLLEHYGGGTSSIAELVQRPNFNALDLVEINAVGALHRFLERLPRLRYTEYAVGGEDIQSLSYADESFDLVLTSDTLEHVPEWQRALAESRRVLRGGGRHILTVPLVPTRARTLDVRTNGWYHGRGRGPYAARRRQPDYKVYTVFGLDFLDALRAAHFEPEVHFGDAASVICGRAV